jgi:hypothetical protein
LALFYPMGRQVEKGNGLGRQPERKMVLVAVVVFIVVDFQVVDVSVTNVVGLASPRAISALLMALPITAKPNGSGFLSSKSSSVTPNGGTNEPWRRWPEETPAPGLTNLENSSAGCWKSSSSILNPIPGLAVGSTLVYRIQLELN